MADINNKPKLQLRSGLSVNGEKSPSPATKLLLNHGKPNFTIQRSPKIMNGDGVENGNGNPWPTATRTKLPPPAAEPFKTNEFVVKSTSFNGVLKPSIICKTSMQQQNEQADAPEMAKVVLRRAKVHHEPALKQDEDENVPEFIRRQRRIQERLAKENVLDFENRRSGYFTQVLISPTSPNRQSFVETMSSPAIVPGLEIPPPASPTQREADIQEEETKHEDTVEEVQSEGLANAVPISLNGHGDEEEVNRAIEEVNKAVAGEDDDKTSSEELQQEENTVVAITSVEYVETTSHQEFVEKSMTTQSTTMTTTSEDATPVQVAVVTTSSSQEKSEATSTAMSQQTIQQVEVTTLPITQEDVKSSQLNGHVKADITQAFLNAERNDAQVNGSASPVITNGNSTNGHHEDNDEITISHTNGLNAPTLPTPDPSGEKGVNYETKTVVSFSQEMGSEVNKYPDTVKVTKEVATAEADNDEDLKELAKLKFEIKEGQQDIEVTPVLKVE